MKLPDTKYLIGGSLILGLGLGKLFSAKHASGSTPSRQPSPFSKPGGNMTLIPVSELSDAFFQGVLDMTNAHQQKGAGVTGYDYLAVWFSESGVSPSSRNAQGFGGLNGMGPRERTAVGFTGDLDAWCALSAEEQLPYVRRYIENDIGWAAHGDYSQFQQARDLYLLNFAPAAFDPSWRKKYRDDMPLNDDFIIYSLAKDGKNYSANKQMDTDNKGYITLADLGAFLQRNVHGQRWESIRARYDAVQAVS